MSDFFAPGLDTVTGSNKGAPMKVALPGGGYLQRSDKTDVELVIFGPDSDRCKALQRVRTRAAVELSALNLTSDAREDQLEVLDLDFLAGMVKSWNVQLGDETNAPCDPATVKRFLSAYPVAKEQADRFIARRAAFTSASSES